MIFLKISLVGTPFPCVPAPRVRAPFHESNVRLYKTKIMTKNKTS